MSNLKKIFIGMVVSVCLLFNSHISLYGNGIRFKNSNEEIPVETTEMHADDITVLLSKNVIYAVTMTFNSHNDHPDAVILMDRTNVPCKVLNLYANKVLVDFPKSWIKSLRIDFAGDGDYSDEQNFNERSRERFNEVEERVERGRFDDRRLRRKEDFINNDHAGRGRDRDRYPDTDRRTSDRYPDNVERRVRRRNRNDFEETPYYYNDDFEDDDGLDIVMLEDDPIDNYQVAVKPDRVARSDVKDWLLSEIREAKSEKKRVRRPANRRQPEQFDLLDKTLQNDNVVAKNNRRPENNRRSENTERVRFDSNKGRIKGRFLYSGNALDSCKVRLVKLRKEGLVYYKDTVAAETIESSTDGRGVYAFNNITPGYYKLYWKPPTESSWIRRVSMEPDVIVTAGEIANLDAIETNRRILN
ncbi:MAG: hypothetical protein ACUZ8H_07985 [Candidatus Anammoxibacter sp.]